MLSNNAKNASDPGLAEIRLELSKKEIKQGNLTGTVNLITDGFAIEKSQYVRCSVRLYLL